MSFSTWKEVMAYAKAGGTLGYQAPMDNHPLTLRPGKNATYCYQAKGRTIRIWPPGSVGRGNSRYSDPFTADSGHLSRFRRLDG